MTAEQRAKLQSELDVVQGNMAVLGEMLSEVIPGKEQPGDLELLQVHPAVDDFNLFYLILLIHQFLGIKRHLPSNATETC